MPVQSRERQGRQTDENKLDAGGGGRCGNSGVVDFGGCKSAGGAREAGRACAQGRAAAPQKQKTSVSDEIFKKTPLELFLGFKPESGAV